ncbi:MAG: C39 family peptidase [Oscillospiraceae bacterium]|nr:C39 family peptidase [Oscillospiraceae bacterium]
MKRKRKGKPVLILISIAGLCAVAYFAFLRSKSVIPKSVILDVPFISQKADFPTGCESVSAVMALNYLGVDITVDEFVDDYLDTGNAPSADKSGKLVGTNPRRAFVGDPRSEHGWGCYASVIVNAVNKIIDSAKFTVSEISDKTIDELCREYIDNGVPVLIWATVEMVTPLSAVSWTDEITGERIEWVSPMHCLVLVGYDKDCYYFNDPLEHKNISHKKSLVKSAYDGLYRQAVVIEAVR